LPWAAVQVCREVRYYDSPERMFDDLVRWHDYRFSDREIVRAFCTRAWPRFDFLLAHGVQFPDRSPVGADGGPQTVKRAPKRCLERRCERVRPDGSERTALMRPLEASARKLGVQILLRHSMTGLIRDNNLRQGSGNHRHARGQTLNIQARRGVVLSTGGHTSNVNFRRISIPV